jgi:hypothetical protein
MKVVSKGLRELEKWKIPSSEALTLAFFRQGKGMLGLVSLTGQVFPPVEFVHDQS